jgi:hypothetical protein
MIRCLTGPRQPPSRQVGQCRQPNGVPLVALRLVIPGDTDLDRACECFIVASVERDLAWFRTVIPESRGFLKMNGAWALPSIRPGHSRGIMGGCPDRKKEIEDVRDGTENRGKPCGH